MDTHTDAYTYVKEPANMGELMHKDAMRYRRLKVFVDTLVIMDRNKGALHFEKRSELDEYIDSLGLVPTTPLTTAAITKHALEILEGQLTMTMKESKE